ncbi:type IV pilus assembly protein PilM [uncultured Pseudokineococcus sp.]|uniref:type IV pilus assembly protein PilM n=1 Tax=uncultured Pseudokineococcus sp. TaxID=1642928 RepID=UPI0026327297|nr:type IV pilus assembly protein PilM [uncultured Pseudokineococcus sp.]
MARSSIGLDIGTSGVRAAEVAHTKAGPVLARFASVALPHGAVRDGDVLDGPAVAAALTELWSLGRFRSRKVTIGVASQRVVVRSVDLPKMPPEDLRKALPFQVQDVLPMPVDEAVLDFQPVEERTSGGQTTIRGLLVAASEDAVMARVEAVRAAGLRVVGVDLVPFALLRSVASPPGSRDGAEAVVDIGARVTNVAVHAQGAPRFVRVLLGGGDRVVDELVTSGLDPDDARRLLRDEGVAVDARLDGGDPRSAAVVTRAAERLADGVRGSLDYYAATQGADPLRGVVLVGGTALVPGFADLLSDVVGLPVRRGDALSRLVVGPAHEGGPAAEVSALGGVPVGLALGGAA